MIGVVANANAGKSTLINAILGEKVLPQNYKCCTSVITNVTLIDIDEPLMLDHGKEVKGGKNILKAIRALNTEIRETDDAAVKDISLYCKPAPKPETPAATVLKLDGMLKLVDMPGIDETDNQVVKDSMNQLLSMCHGLLIMIKYDGIKSDSFASLITQVEAQAPHLFKTKGAITFVISQADCLRNDTDSSDDEWSVDVISDLKSELCEFVAKRLPQIQTMTMMEDIPIPMSGPKYPNFVRDVHIVATSVDQKLCGGHDFGQLLEILSNLHSLRSELILQRKVSLCDAISDEFQNVLSDTRGSWPEAAQDAITGRNAEVDFWQKIMILSTIVTIPLGGAALWAGCAVRGAAAAAALGMGLISSELAGNAGGATLGGQCVVGAGQVDAVGATKAAQRLRDENLFVVAREAEHGSTYKDVKMAGGKVLYIGEFRYKQPHGLGRLFWPSTQYEAFIGDFECGQPTQGIFLNELGFFVGHVKKVLGQWTVSGYQADDPSESTGVCNICFERPSMQTEQRIFSPCGHGHACTQCAKDLSECPTCRSVITDVVRF